MPGETSKVDRQRVWGGQMKCVRWVGRVLPGQLSSSLQLAVHSETDLNRFQGPLASGWSQQRGTLQDMKGKEGLNWRTYSQALSL